MSDPEITPQPDAPRTPEQHAAVRRRSLPVAFAGAAMGIGGIIIPFTVHVTAFAPPSIAAMNFAFCAIMIGAGILFYSKGTPGTGSARILCIIAILAGMAGSMVYTKQSVEFRQVRENLELENVKAIAAAAQRYAIEHGDTYAPDLLVLLDENYLKPQSLLSPFGKGLMTLVRVDELKTRLPNRVDRLKEIETASDYLYLGGDLKTPSKELASTIIVAASTTTVMRVHLALAFADGRSAFINVDEAENAMKACNEAREKMGLGMLRPPPIIQAAIDDARTEKKGQ